MIDNQKIIIAGGGHAGIEAALASARLGVHTILITMNLQAIGRMSCNPAIGGLAKGHLVREIDSLGGIMGLAADFSGIQFKTLNTSKGRAVWSLRAQVDKKQYPNFIISNPKAVFPSVKTKSGLKSSINCFNLFLLETSLYICLVGNLIT